MIPTSVSARVRGSRRTAFALLAVAALMATGCQWGEELEMPVRVTLENGSSGPAQLWVGHAETPPPGADLDPLGLRADDVTVKVYVDTHGFQPEEGHTFQCKTDYGPDSTETCDFRDEVRVTAMQDGQKTTEKLSLAGRYTPGIIVRWDGKQFVIQAAPAP